MKAKWLISVSDVEYKNVLSILKNQKIKVTNTLEGIGVIITETSKEKIEKIRNTPGVLSIEKEGNATTQY